MSATTVTTTTTTTPEHTRQNSATFRLDEERVQENYRFGKAIDDLWRCYTVGYHVLDYYRYGYRRSCADKWDHVKFCMKINTMSEEEKQREIYKREKAKWEAKRQAPNLADIWEERRQARHT
ncbi:hypothetical protein SYNPS1DRAFT_27154 [Syncephalis pseudoplumigaleata]|uniref:Uncharacterized protein n=1 Tax=Syncephalis pseudoplumigaleata TaxID=1712513 RepID=A0A4P9Z425_9FUNG|nr:hypothetical protein SYNPS1DRAFT_27154 [Syncephalis pseudoplumigaleata]|eukprot:RKP27185.1 hypothetical protein SYNPS1DRAFT_27154 [Syncephalis pseudoplumigaleata]